MDGKPSFPSYVGDFLVSCDDEPNEEAEKIISGTAAVAYGGASFNSSLTFILDDLVFM